ncbi:MAG TPA: hypothetical protein VKQ08_11680 [Cyclobacteriaceae bacterium]|nr:hypothetical protein [Cyclobacteriaceae bacterium]
MKTKHAIIILALGYCFDFLGAFQKILHTAYADLLLLIAMFLKIFGMLLFVYKVVTNPKAKEFLNW